MKPFDLRTTKMVISLKNLKFHAFHGVMEQERVVGNEFIVNLSVVVDTTQAMIDDNLKGTVSYADLYNIVAEEMTFPSDLLENVCIRIAERVVKENNQVFKGMVEVIKTAPPIPGMTGDASVKYKFDRYSYTGDLPF